ncbi:MAG: GFA family protein [Alphaproteobacteria bacterium]|nr:GFA family protein [Alphaproteobacteria bacterium]
MIYTGGCQCGKTRYRAEGPRDRASVCYCRMCQRASGAPFMAFVRFAVRQVTWSNPPAIFTSSNRVERGFCSGCGTPLTYRQIEGPYVSLTLNSLDDPSLVEPEFSFSTECRAGWLARLDDLTRLDMDFTASADFVSYQSDKG